MKESVEVTATPRLDPEALKEVLEDMAGVMEQLEKASTLADALARKLKGIELQFD